MHIYVVFSTSSKCVLLNVISLENSNYGFLNRIVAVINIVFVYSHLKRKYILPMLDGFSEIFSRFL